MNRHLTRGGPLLRLLRRLAGTALLLAAAATAVACTIGFPQRFVNAVVDRIDLGIFAVEARGARLDLLRGIELEDLRLYRRGVVGPPVAEGEGVLIGLDPLAWLKHEMMVRRISVQSSLARPLMLEGPVEPSRGLRPMKTSTIRVELRRSELHGIAVENLALTVRTRGYVVDVDGVEADLAQGSLRGAVRASASYDLRTKSLTGRVEARADPRMFLTALEEWGAGDTAALVREAAFRDTPACELQFERVVEEGRPTDLRGTFAMKDFAFRGVDLLRADGHIALRLSRTNSAVRVTSGLLVRDEGIARGSFAIYSREKRLVFDGTSSMDPKALARLTGLTTNDVAPGVRFGSVRIEAQGEVDMDRFAETSVSARVDARDIAVDKFSVDECAFALRMHGMACALEGIKGKLYGGPLWGSAAMFFPPPASKSRDIRYGLNLAFQDGSFAALVTDLLREEGKDYRGDFSGVLKAEGSAGAGKGRTVTGGGVFRIRRGRVFLLPVFGGLSEVLTKLIPGLEFILRQSDATVNFGLADGKVKAEKVSIEGEVLSLAARGEYGFGGDVDFDAQLTLMKEHTAVAKVLRMLTYPISKLMEFRVRGTFQKPLWYPLSLSSDILDRIGLGALDEFVRPSGGAAREAGREKK